MTLFASLYPAFPEAFSPVFPVLQVNSPLLLLYVLGRRGSPGEEGGGGGCGSKGHHPTGGLPFCPPCTGVVPGNTTEGIV